MPAVSNMVLQGPRDSLGVRLLLRTERASRVSGKLHGCKPRGARGVCAFRRAACRPCIAYHGRCGTALLLMLASWLGGCDAGGTVCAHETGNTDRICHGTWYEGSTGWCALLPYPPCATNERT